MDKKTIKIIVGIVIGVVSISGVVGAYNYVQQQGLLVSINVPNQEEKFENIRGSVTLKNPHNFPVSSKVSLESTEDKCRVDPSSEESLGEISLGGGESKDIDIICTFPINDITLRVFSKVGGKEIDMAKKTVNIVSPISVTDLTFKGEGKCIQETCPPGRVCPTVLRLKCWGWGKVTNLAVKSKLDRTRIPLKVNFMRGAGFKADDTSSVGLEAGETVELESKNLTFNNESYFNPPSIFFKIYGTADILLERKSSDLGFEIIQGKRRWEREPQVECRQDDDCKDEQLCTDKHKCEEVPTRGECEDDSDCIGLGLPGCTAYCKKTLIPHQYYQKSCDKKCEREVGCENNGVCESFETRKCPDCEGYSNIFSLLSFQALSFVR